MADPTRRPAGPRFRPFTPTATAGRFERLVREQLAAQPLAPAVPVTAADLAPLPAPVQRFLQRAGVVGRPRVRRFRVSFDADIYQRPGARPLPCRIIQYSFTDDPARFFFIRSRMAGLPVRVLHAYARAHATMQVRVAGCLDLVDLAGPELGVAETVTYLNDLCLLAPGALLDPRVRFEAVDDRTARVHLSNDPHQVSASLHFDEEGDLVDFVSHDRYDLMPDGALRRGRWSTPLRGHRDLGGRRLPEQGDAIWDRPEGDFTYGRFRIKAVEYDEAVAFHEA